MRLGQLVVDVTPARASRDFRIVLICRSIVLLAAGFIAVAVPVQVYQLTRSSLQVGLVSLALGLALLVGFIAGGVLADTLDRKRLIVLSSTGVAVAFAVFAVNAAIDSPHQLFVIYLTVIVGGAIEGVGETALTAVTPALVTEGQLAAASGLIAVTSQLGAIVGPALGGIVVASAGLAADYGLAALAIAITTVVLARLRPHPPMVDEDAAGSTEDTEFTSFSGVVRSLREGFSFVRHNRLIAGVLLIDLCATGFGVPQTLFPQMAAEQFGGGPELVGILAAAPAAGALIASIGSGWTGRLRPTGAALVVSILVLGLSYIGFGLSGYLVLAVFFLAVTGGADCISEILRRALLQHHTPDRLQGRVNSLWLAQAGTSYSLGGTTSGLAAALAGPALAIIGAGTLCIAGVTALAVKLPELRRATLTTVDAVDPECGSPSTQRQCPSWPAGRVRAVDEPTTTTK